MKTITIKQPWASLICEGIKDIENRSWATKFRGRVLVHAAQKDFDFRGYMTSEYQREFIKGIKKPYVKGSIIGSVEIVDCIKSKDNPNKVWGNLYCYYWVLANPVLFDTPIIDVKGKLSFWEYEFDEGTFECTNDNPYSHQSCGEREGCIQNCDECDYWKSKYEL